MSCKDSQPLNTLQIGSFAAIASIDGDAKLTKRLLSLGLRVGSQVNVVQHRNQGVVVANSGNRVALGRSIADKLLVTPIADNAKNSH
jgi:ferrous iron transport protein A